MCDIETKVSALEARYLTTEEHMLTSIEQISNVLEQILKHQTYQDIVHVLDKEYESSH